MIKHGWTKNTEKFPAIPITVNPVMPVIPRDESEQSGGLSTICGVVAIILFAFHFYLIIISIAAKSSLKFKCGAMYEYNEENIT